MLSFQNMNIPVTLNEQWEHLSEQLVMLGDSCRLYDQAKYHEAKRIATIASTLLIDGGKNFTSLLTQMGLEVKILDTSTDWHSENLLNHLGLVTFQLSAGASGSRAIYKAPLDSLSPNRQGKVLSRSEWLNKIVLTDGSNVFSRKDLIRNFRDKDGGSHVDPMVPEQVKAIRRKELAQVTPVIEDTVHEFENRPDLESVRQIGYEVLLSLNELKKPL